MVLVLIAANGYRIAANKPSEGELAAEYEAGEREGELAGEASAEAEAEGQIKQAKGKAYWHGWEEGPEEGEDAGRREGAERATPANLDFQTRYMITYEPGPNGPELRGFLEMPLNTLWECEDLDGCTEFGG
jgi:hypothetical protein